MVRKYKEKEVLAAWRRRQGLSSGWMEFGEEVMTEIESQALIELQARYSYLLRNCNPEDLPCMDFSGEELLQTFLPNGTLSIAMPQGCVRVLEVELEGGETIRRLENPVEMISPILLRELTGGVKNPIGYLTGDEIRIEKLGKERAHRMKCVIMPPDGEFILSPELFPELFEIRKLEKDET